MFSFHHASLPIHFIRYNLYYYLGINTSKFMIVKMVIKLVDI